MSSGSSSSSSSSNSSSSSSPSKRARGEVQLYAKAQEELCRVVFSASYGAAGTRDLRLFEAPEEALQWIQDGHNLQLIGEANGDTVLCTGSKTYAIKKVETSNHIFFVGPSSSTEFALTSRTMDYYEVKAIAPRIDQIECLLRPTQYNGAEAEAEAPPSAALLLTRRELETRVQASATELQAALRDAGVLEIAGHMRLVSGVALRETSRNLLDTVMENGWDMGALIEAECSRATQIDPVLLRHALGLLGEEDGGRWRLHADKVGRVTAHVLFLAQSSSKVPQSDYYTSHPLHT